ncbi:4138_t:CDS:2 [Gigaspora margarita]|uniref:4138_t:CDS:1 n=1 Tax=Gigaspora margarita TaxID=4874 RepID=A0ABN7VPT7_GIGMA|nr:4138_t:CDS:2 [Gigaspora margarita]
MKIALVSNELNKLSTETTVEFILNKNVHAKSNASADLTSNNIATDVG